MSTALYNLGVRDNTISKEGRRFLDKNGYLNLGPLLTTAEVDAINDKISEILDKEGEGSGDELLESKHILHPKEVGVNRVADLVNKDPLFKKFITSPRVLAAMSHVIKGKIKLSSLNYRASLPGYGMQSLHVDWHESVLADQYKVCNSIWLLDDFNVENGATRLVPGSQLKGKLPQDEMEDPLATHPDEIIIEATAGTVIIFNSHVWHGGTVNYSNKPRRAIHSYFCAHDQPQQLDQSKYIKEESKKWLGKDAVALLDV